MFTLFGQVIPVPVFVPEAPQNEVQAAGQAFGYFLGSAIGTLFLLGLLIYLYVKREPDGRGLVWFFVAIFSGFCALSAFAFFGR